ncbi:MAG: hypothetical protein E3J35_04280 [Methanomassiliicoccales archaeon]|nr:MAG: hypothetical protein E3J35_04280 [Methanomassiliicoccales archaeon]
MTRKEKLKDLGVKLNAFTFNCLKEASNKSPTPKDVFTRKELTEWVDGSITSQLKTLERHGYIQSLWKPKTGRSITYLLVIGKDKTEAHFPNTKYDRFKKVIGDQSVSPKDQYHDL